MSVWLADILNGWKMLSRGDECGTACRGSGIVVCSAGEGVGGVL